MEDIVSFGEWVRRRRQALDLSRAALADQVGCSPVTIKKIERDERRPSRQIAELLAQELELPEPMRSQFIQMGRGQYVPVLPSPLEGISQPLPGQAAAAQEIPHNLPLQPTPFIGREQELTELGALLADPDVRLVTIVGPGGIGKTRLAMACAERQLRSGASAEPQAPAYSHGIYFASLARLETADMLLPVIAGVIGFHFVEGGDARAELLRFLRQKRMLLILDNFEHLLDGASLIDEILHAAPGITLLVTSRVRLKRQAEHLFSIGGLSYPTGNIALDDELIANASSFGSLQLFQHCALRIQRQFTLTTENLPAVVEICRLAEGMPLGIILAASWLNALSPAEIVREMRRDLDFLATDMGDVPRRQRSLRAAFNHSWRLLGQREREMFCQMSIFRGGFTRAAAQAVTGAGLRDLQALVNKSLLALGSEGRYEVHELLRQFAAEKLDEASDLAAAVRDRHSAFYCALLQGHSDNWRNARQLETLAEVTREADNAQLAWRRALQQEVWPRLYEALDSWGWYLQWRGLHAEGEAFCQAVCDGVESWLATEPADAAVGYRLWAKAMAWSGVFAMAIKVAAQRFRQSLALLARPELAREDTRQIEAFALLSLGNRLSDFNRQESRSYVEECLSLYEALQDSWGTATALHLLGYLDWSMGDYVLAQKRAQASLDILQAHGDQQEQVYSLGLLGWIRQHLGQLAEAEQSRHEAVELCQQLGYRYRLASCMGALSYTVVFRGRFEEGKTWAKKALNLCLEDGYLKLEGWARLAIGFSMLLAGQYGQAEQELRRSLALVREVNDRGTEASVHCCLGELALAEVAYDRAQAEFEEGLRLYEATQGDAYTCSALSGLGFSTCCRGELDQSRRHFVELLTEGLRRKDFLWLLYALPGLALYLARSGEVERAAAVWAQAQSHPYLANSQLYEDLVGRVVAEATADLPPELLAAARENGRSLDIWQMAEQLLAELTRHS